jgi:hypothetical protein
VLVLVLALGKVGHEAYGRARLSCVRLVQRSTGPRGHGWTGCRSLDVWDLDRRRPVSEPSPFQGYLQHNKGTGSLLGCHDRSGL